MRKITLKKKRSFYLTYAIALALLEGEFKDIIGIREEGKVTAISREFDGF